MSENQEEKPGPRKRSLTELTLGWFAERLRKADVIKEAVKEGKYDLDSQKIAQSIIHKES